MVVVVGRQSLARATELSLSRGSRAFGDTVSKILHTRLYIYQSPVEKTYIVARWATPD